MLRESLLTSASLSLWYLRTFFPSFFPACLHVVVARLLLIASDANVPYFYLIPPVSLCNECMLDKLQLCFSLAVGWI